jgi:hypothetical protein
MQTAKCRPQTKVKVKLAIEQAMKAKRVSRFSVPLQADPGAHSSSYIRGDGSLSRG